MALNSLYWFKALHIIGVVCWFAGLFYLVRLFIYHTEAQDRPAAERRVLTEQFALMERRLWLGITVPAMWITLTFGVAMMVQLEAWNLPWFQVKLALLFGLFAYHSRCGRIRQELAAGKFVRTSRGLRVYNEVATVYLVAIVPVAVTKDPWAFLWSLGGLGILGLLIYLGRFAWLKAKSSK